MTGSKKKFHMRMVHHKGNEAGGAAPLSADDDLMEITQQYDKIAAKVFPHRGLFLLTSRGKQLKWSETFATINR